MKPRSHHQHVEDSRILFLDALISAERAEEIFVVIPTAYGHHGGVNVLQVGEDVAIFPELIVVRMLHHLIPELEAHAQFLFVNVAGVLHAAHRQIKLVTILSSVIKRFHITII